MRRNVTSEFNTGLTLVAVELDEQHQQRVTIVGLEHIDYLAL